MDKRHKLLHWPKVKNGLNSSKLNNNNDNDNEPKECKGPKGGKQQRKQKQQKKTNKNPGELSKSYISAPSVFNQSFERNERKQMLQKKTNTNPGELSKSYISEPSVFNLSFEPGEKLNDDNKMWEVLGKKICKITKDVLPTDESLVEMDAMELASFLLAAHVKKFELDPDEGCVLVSEEVRRILHSKQQQKLLCKSHNAIPRVAAPLSCELPPPPARWFTKPKSDLGDWVLK